MGKSFITLDETVASLRKLCNLGRVCSRMFLTQLNAGQRRSVSLNLDEFPASQRPCSAASLTNRTRRPMLIREKPSTRSPGELRTFSAFNKFLRDARLTNFIALQ